MPARACVCVCQRVRVHTRLQGNTIRVSWLQRLPNLLALFLPLLIDLTALRLCGASHARHMWFGLALTALAACAWSFDTAVSLGHADMCPMRVQHVIGRRTAAVLVLSTLERLSSGVEAALATQCVLWALALVLPNRGRMPRTIFIALFLLGSFYAAGLGLLSMFSPSSCVISWELHTWDVACLLFLAVVALIGIVPTFRHFSPGAGRFILWDHSLPLKDVLQDDVGLELFGMVLHPGQRRINHSGHIIGTDEAPDTGCSGADSNGGAQNPLFPQDDSFPRQTSESTSSPMSSLLFFGPRSGSIRPAFNETASNVSGTGDLRSPTWTTGNKDDPTPRSGSIRPAFNETASNVSGTGDLRSPTWTTGNKDDPTPRSGSIRPAFNETASNVSGTGDLRSPTWTTGNKDDPKSGGQLSICPANGCDDPVPLEDVRSQASAVEEPALDGKQAGPRPASQASRGLAARDLETLGAVTETPGSSCIVKLIKFNVWHFHTST